MKNSRKRIILAIVLMATMLLAACGAQPNAGAAKSPDASAATSTVTSQDTMPIDPEATDGPETAPPSVTDLTYWRLVRQGKAAEIPDMEAQFEIDHEWLNTLPRLSEQFERNLDELMSDGIEQPFGGVWTFYSVSSTDAKPGEVIARFNLPTGKIIISVPELSGELAEFVQERGDDWLMVYSAETVDGSLYEECTLSFYQDEGFVQIMVGDDGTNFWALTTNSRHCQVNWSLNSSSRGLLGDRVDIGYGSGVNTSIARHGIVHSNEKSYQRDLEYYKDFDDVKIEFSDQAAEFDESHYDPSPTQMQLLRELMAELESQPLADFPLN